MRSKQDIAGLGHSNTPKRFKFVLSCKDENDLVLIHAPDGWKEGELTFIRDKEYKGVIQSYSTNELTFVKEGRDYVQRGYERGGIDYEIKIKIYLLKNSNFKYQSYFVGKIDLATYKIDSIGVTCEVTPTGFQDVVLNREDLDVDVTSNKTIGGGTIDALTNVPGRVTIPEYSATQNAEWLISGSKINVEGFVIKKYHVPLTANVSEFSESEINSQTFTEFEILPNQTFFNSDGEYILNFSLYLSVTYVSKSTASRFDTQVHLYKNGSIVKTYSKSEKDVLQSTQIFNETEELEIVVGDQYSLTINTLGRVDYNLSIDGNSLSLDRDLGEDINASFVYMFYIYEAFFKVLQLISKKAKPFYSKFLGRTDSETDTYTEDGEGSLMTITNGKWIRQFDRNVNPFNLNLKDLFKTINGIYNVGLEFSEDPIGNEVVRLEKEQYFYDIEEDETESKIWKTNQILDLSDWLNNEVIEKEVLPDWYANEVESGYSKFDYENIQGLKEFNTVSTWSIPIRSVKSKLDLTSAYRADTQGVNKLKQKTASEFPTEDVSGDNDVFVFDVKRYGILPDIIFTVKTDEDFISVVGGVDPEQSYNLDFTPRRNLERHGSRFRSMQIPLGKELQWLKSDKNSKVQTQKTDEDSIKQESGDIQFDSLTPGYWIPEAYIFEAPVDEDVISAIQTNPRGVIKIDKDKYGWILEVQTNSETRKGSFKLLRVDLSNVRIVS